MLRLGKHNHWELPTILKGVTSNGKHNSNLAATSGVNLQYWPCTVLPWKVPWLQYSSWYSVNFYPPEPVGKGGLLISEVNTSQTKKWTPWTTDHSRLKVHYQQVIPFSFTPANYEKHLKMNHILVSLLTCFWILVPREISWRKIPEKEYLENEPTKSTWKKVPRRDT